MKFASLFFIFAALPSTVFAMGSGVAIERITKADGITHIHYTIGGFGGPGEPRTLNDDDGLASLALVHGLLLNEGSRKLLTGPIGDKSFADVNVEGWSTARPAVIASLERLKAFYEKQQVEVVVNQILNSAGAPMSFKLQIEKVVGLIKTVKAKPTLTYSDLNQIGSFIDDANQTHTYEVLREGKPSATLAVRTAFFSGSDYQFPARAQSKCKDSVAGDLKAISREITSAASANPSSGGGSTTSR